jgi:V/A-type H+-transporting ATPase subunit D
MEMGGFLLLPTKKNLLVAKQNLLLARKGHGLLDMKLNALMRDLKKAEKAAAELREKLEKVLDAAERALIIAKMETGEGINISEARELNETNIAYDEAYFIWQKVFAVQEELTKAEEAVAQIKIKKTRTKKRVSALQNIKIPYYEKNVKFISEQLEERERDEMMRLRKKLAKC